MDNEEFPMLDEEDIVIIKECAKQLRLSEDNSMRIIELFKFSAILNKKSFSENQRFIDLNDEMLESLLLNKKPGDINSDDVKSVLNNGAIMGFNENEVKGAVVLSMLRSLGEEEKALIRMYVDMSAHR